MAVSQVTAQVATKEASAVILPATNALWSVAGGTNALQERVAVLQMRRAPVLVDGTARSSAGSTNHLEPALAGPAVMDVRQVRAALAPPPVQTTTGSPGGALMSLTVGYPILNVDFADTTKTGFAAIGQDANDYWNPYVMPYVWLGTLQNLLWSDQSPSPVDLTVANAPGQWGSLLCVDPMYASYIYRYPWSGNITVTIGELPADTYDLYVYATRASDDGAPVVELKRAGVSLWTKGTTLWGNNWYSTYWDEHEQYVRFRNITVNQQSITLEMFPDSYGYPSISGIQIVPSWAVPPESPAITRLLNVNFGGQSGSKTGFAAVGLSANDFWNAVTHAWQPMASWPGLQWSDQTGVAADMTVVNGPGFWGNALPDPMFRSYMYAHDGGNITITLTDLPAGICDVYLYGHTTTPDDNAVFELWSDDVNWGTKGTSLIGDGPTYATWEVGQQYVRFRDVTVTAGRPMIIQAKHTTYGYNNVSGFQIAYTGEADTDADGLPDGWERRCFGNLDQTADGDPDGDGLPNRREYQLGTDPTRTDSNANGLSDLYDFETVWVEDVTPQGGYEGGLNEDWNWVSDWWDGVGWGGQTLYPHSGRWWDPRMHVSAHVPGAAHQHSFESAVATLRPGAGDVLYAYVNLDPTYPPSEVMLQWYVREDGTSGSAAWNHRAYWGANNINWDVNGTASRYYMGPLPEAGQWVRLEVPASAVGVAGKIVEGMAFTLYGGRAAWDSAGAMKPDHDGDGLPDWWEMQYFGNLLQTAEGDADEDWLTNLEEYQLGTDPTNPDTDGDGLPDGWEWMHFGSFAPDDQSDYDGDGASDLAEYLAGTDPNTIAFRLVVTNNFVSTTVPTVQVAISGGQPFAQAVLVDNTNFAEATWSSYLSTNVEINLGTTEGWREVWIGLRGRQPTSEQTWQRKWLKLDLTPPALVFTSPAGDTVSQPMLQLQGYCAEALSRLACDLSNASGVFTNQMILVLDQHYDRTARGFTTNTFQAFDLELTNGLNTLTVQAVDLAGNTATTNLSFTLVSDTNAPGVQLYWPQAGTRLSGDSFTWRGWVDDFTATLTAAIVDGGGTTNERNVLVERDGHFWAEELPLGAGTNWLTLTAVDAWDNVAVTNIMVVKSDLTLTIDPVASEQLHEPTVTVNGGLGGGGYTVRVNGVKATDNGDGTWTADNVPLPVGGTAVLQARAIPNSDNGGHGTGGTGGSAAGYADPGNPESAQARDREAVPEKPAGVYIAPTSIASGRLRMSSGCRL